MKFEQFDTLFENTLTELGWTSLTPLQEKLIHKVKQGKNLFIDLPKNSGVSSALQLISFMKAPQAFEGSPRVLWFTSDANHVDEYIAEMQKWSRRTEIAVETASEKGKIILQRNNIFEGADIIIGNPTRILELYNQNGIHVNQLSLIIIDDAATMCKNPLELQRIRRVHESLPKCQRIISTHGTHHRMEEFVDELCGFHETIDEENN